MKLRKDDKVIVLLGKDKGKTGKVTAVIPGENKVLVEGINVVKRHTKPTDKLPRGGILDITKPIDVSKVMVLDPATGKPARVGFQIKPDGTKERVFKVSANHDRKPAKADKSAKSTDKESPKVAPSETKVGKK
ncbi:50S ribosomal protein L24 [Candidatus Saccharibacteria bacterium]|nr:50S ribosomal protein L24 [Candidatus Saccharibacteria bacterium]